MFQQVCEDFLAWQRQVRKFVLPPHLLPDPRVRRLGRKHLVPDPRVRRQGRKHVLPDPRVRRQDREPSRGQAAAHGKYPII